MAWRCWSKKLRVFVFFILNWQLVIMIKGVHNYFPSLFFYLRACLCVIYFSFPLNFFVSSKVYAFSQGPFWFFQYWQEKHQNNNDTPGKYDICLHEVFYTRQRMKKLASRYTTWRSDFKIVMTSTQCFSVWKQLVLLLKCLKKDSKKMQKITIEPRKQQE